MRRVAWHIDSKRLIRSKIILSACPASDAQVASTVALVVGRPLEAPLCTLDSGSWARRVMDTANLHKNRPASEARQLLI
ncbi:hypothetical protein C8T65DRAFT_293970 [Cerioporus squamosus]|nr:hypothetical protein C8T65DRAFT_293970 [Cerioporus squamosus]